MSILFCRVPWFEEYDGTESNMPEAENFLPVEITGEDGSIHSLLLGTLSGKNELDISILTDRPAEGFASGVTVVFCADAPNGSLAVIGWYENANVSARKESMTFSDDKGESTIREFFFCCHVGDAVLLPVEERFSFLSVPRCKTKTAGKFGFSSDPVWYARESAAKGWVSDAVRKIAAYDGENWLDEETDTGDDGTETNE